MRINKKYYLIFLLASIYDVAISYHNISMGVGKEGNPFAAFLISIFGPGLGLIIHKSAGVISITLYLRYLPTIWNSLAPNPEALSEHQLERYGNPIVLMGGSLAFFIAGSTWLIY